MPEQVVKDARWVVSTVANAWHAQAAHGTILHEMHSVHDGTHRGSRQSELVHQRLSPQVLDDIRAKLDLWAESLARGARAANTVDALRRDLKSFCTWCSQHGHLPLPASQLTLCDYLRAHASSRKVSTLRRHLASVATLHSAAGLTNPTLGELVKSELDLIARNQARSDQAARRRGGAVRFEKRQAEGLREDDLIAADALFPNTLRGLRDRAIVWLAFDTLARSSELAEMRVGDLRPQAGGQMTVRLHHSKSDQYGVGQDRYVSTYTAERLQAWLRAADITSGYLFRGIDTRFAEGGRAKKDKKKTEVVRDSASRQVIYRAIKRCADCLYGAGIIQFDPARYSAHSTRVGAAQDMLAEGVSMLAVQQAGGWKTDVMPQQYASRIHALEGGTAQLARKRGRAPAE